MNPTREYELSPIIKSIVCVWGVNWKIVFKILGNILYYIYIYILFFYFL